MVVLLGSSVFAQKIDTAKISYKPKAKVTSRVPQIKANITPYKPNTVSFGSGSNQTTVTPPAKAGKILTVLKIYPNPVETFFSITVPDTVEQVTITNSAGDTVKHIRGNNKTLHPKRICMKPRV
ncbi:hypothetical protein EON73_02890 [bacterium]|nr:MAG: hypothetical protein EON73_02890 [bacterium]